MWKKLFAISLIVGLVSILYVTNFQYLFVNVLRRKVLFTSDELKKYNGVDNPELYLAILGRVFNVTKGVNHYGPGKTYNFFVGKDTSRSFVTGVSENVNSDVADLSEDDLRSLNYWIKFYWQQYQYIGKLIGKYYNEEGKATPYLKLVKKLIKQAERSRENEQLEKRKYPPCNVEWDLEKGSHFWCTDKSGGIERDWIGVPRQYYKIGSENYICVCANEQTQNLGQLKEFQDCDNTGQHCYVK